MSELVKKGRYVYTGRIRDDIRPLTPVTFHFYIGQHLAFVRKDNDVGLLVPRDSLKPMELKDNEEAISLLYRGRDT